MTRQLSRAEQPLEHYTLAKEIYPKGAELICDKCDLRLHADFQEIASFFGEGWPKHCGEFMRQKRIE